MMHRLREAMPEGDPAPMGGNGKIIEADETYIGRKPRTSLAAHAKHKAASAKNVVMTLVERGGSGPFVPYRRRETEAEMRPDHSDANSDRDTQLKTDEARDYDPWPTNSPAMTSVNHTRERIARRGRRKITRTRLKATTRFSSAA